MSDWSENSLGAQQLLEASLDPGWAEADPDTHLYVMVDHRREHNLTPTELEAVVAWLVRQPVPVIGLGDEDESALAQAMDLFVSPGSEAERAVTNVQRNPQACAVLVQVLRASTRLDVMQALNLESLGYSTLQAGSEFASWLSDRRETHTARSVPARDDMVLLQRDGERLQIVLNAPETQNSMSCAMRDALSEAFKLVAMDTSVATVEVSGAGKSFSSGGELEEFGTLANPGDAHRVRMLRMPARFLAGHSQRYHFRLHRACIGAGIEVPAFAGRVTASANTFFQLPETNMGLIPGAGGCVSIPRRIGRQRTAYMAILNKKINARRALEWGLIDEIDAEV